MFKKETTKMRGVMKLTLRNKNGEIKKLWNENRLGRFLRTKLHLDLQGIFFLGHWADSLSFHNIITSAGKAGMASRCNGDGSEAVFNYLAVGTGTTAASVDDTALEAEIVDSGLARASADISRTTTNVSNDTAKLSHTWSATASKAITEAGALNAASNGTLLGRQTFSAVNVDNGDSFQLDYSFVFSV